MSLRRRNVTRTVSVVEEEDEESSSPTEPINPPRPSSSTTQDRNCSLSVALQRFSEYLVHKIETRDHTPNDDDENQEQAVRKTAGQLSRIVNMKIKSKKKLKRNKSDKERPRSSPVTRYCIIGSSIKFETPSSSQFVPHGGLIEALTTAQDDSPDFGDSSSDGCEKKKTRKQSTVNRNTSSGTGKTSNSKDGLSNMRKPSVNRTATQQNLRRRSTMTKSTAQATSGRQKGGIQRRPSLMTKSAAPANESKSAAPKAAPKAKPSTGGAKMGGVRFLCF